jgi:hypothetical protein
MVTVSPGLASKSVARVSQFEPQNRQLRFVSQNQADFSLSVAPQNRRREDGVGHTSRSDGLLRLKISRARVF